MVEAAQIREQIISLIKNNGPALPVQVAKETGLSILFASAFLSELFGEKVLKISNIRVGSSPLYFLPGQEPQLEKFSQYLKSKEKEAFLILKEEEILRDSELQPAIRVALREIKDFAVPFEKNNEIFWRYFLIEEPNEIKLNAVDVKEPLQELEKEEIILSDEKEVITEQEKVIFKPEKATSKKEKTQKKAKSESHQKKSGKTEKRDDNFFNKIKEFLAKKEIEIIDIRDFRNNEACLKVKKSGNEELLFVFNKKKITEKELLSSNKIASEENMPYSILSLGETAKKLNELISAIKNLSEIGRIE
jgi:hypothetical protein